MTSKRRSREENEERDVFAVYFSVFRPFCRFTLVYLDLCLSLQVFAFKLDQIAARNIRISLDKPIAFSK